MPDGCMVNQFFFEKKEVNVKSSFLFAFREKRIYFSKRLKMSFAGSIKKIGVCLVLVAVVLCGCKKEWKQTTQLDVNIKYDPHTSVQGLTINSLSVNLDKIKFSGKRKQGGDVVFESSPGTAQQDLTVGGARALKYDLPQGDYTQILFDLFLDRPDTNPVIIINATFSDSGSADKQVVIRLASSVYSQSVVKNSSGGSEIQVAYGKTSSLMIALSPGYWFDGIGYDDLDEATYSSSGSGNVIYVDKYNNISIYQSIINRLNIPPTITMQ